jgi:uroporphyrinogen-III decarboxylase
MGIPMRRWLRYQPYNLSHERVTPLIDIVGKDGGYILNGDIGVPDEVKLENVKAMVDFTKEYGVYK